MTEPTPNPDLFLTRRAAKDDPRAWDEIVELYGERIYNLCLQFADHRQEAEDLTQEVFLKLYENLRLYRGDVPFVAWALRLSRNLCIDHYRRHRTRKESEVVPETLDYQASSSAGPEAAAHLAQRRRMVHQELREMPEPLAEVILLRDLQGFSYDEIAALQDVSVGTVKSRIHRARRELVSRLEERFGNGERREAASC